MGTDNRFSGSLGRSHASKGEFWGHLVASADEVRLTQSSLQPIVVRRDTTGRVTFRKVTLPLWWRTEVTFTTTGEGTGYVFVPFRPERVKRRLRELGWPIAEEHTNIRGVWKGLIRRP